MRQPRISFWRTLPALAASIRANGFVIRQLTRREINGRYRSSMLGTLWTVLQPLLMLSVYTFVFGVVVRARWQIPGGEGEAPGGAQFATILFSGLALHSFMAECVGRAPALITGNASYVKKLVFPLDVLVWPLFGGALAHFLVALAILLLAGLFSFGAVPATAVLVPLVLLPFLVLVVGLCFLLATVGVFFRDIDNVIGVLLTAMLFISPIFFPIEILPAPIQALVQVNPLTWVVNALRDVVIWGRLPGLGGYALYSLIAIAVLWGGFYIFQRARRAFASIV